MSKTLYLGIDVSKEKLDCSCVLSTDSPLTHSIFKNNKDGFLKLWDWAKKLEKSTKTDRIHFCMEATGIYSDALSKFLVKEKEAVCSLINPAQIKAFAKSQMVRTKTDKVDSKVIAKYCLIHNPPELKLAEESYEKLKQLQRYLEHLINNRAKERIFIESCIDEDIKQFTRDNIAYLTSQIKRVEEEIKILVSVNEDIKKKVGLIKSIPGLADKSAWAILSEIHSQDETKISIKSQIAHAGLAPMERQSGKSVHGRAKICKTGNPRLRKCLYMPAISTIQSKSVFGDYYRHLIEQGKAKKLAVTAVMRKLLVTALGVLNSNMPYDPDWAKKKQEAFYQKNHLYT